MARVNNINKYPISKNYRSNFFIGTDKTQSDKTVNFSFDGLIEYLNESVTGNISIINFEVDKNMHLKMQLETNTNLDFNLNNDGHLILSN